MERSDRSGFFFALGVYLCGILAIAVYGFTKKQHAAKEKQLEVHYTAGRSFGVLGITLTMFSTIFSGLTVVGIPNSVAAQGFFGVRWITFGVFFNGMQAMLFPRLRQISIVREYLGPTDVISDRCGYGT